MDAQKIGLEKHWFVDWLEKAFGKYQGVAMAMYVSKWCNDQSMVLLNALYAEIMDTYTAYYGNPPLMADILKKVDDAKKRMHVNNPAYFLEYAEPEKDDFYVKTMNEAFEKIKIKVSESETINGL